MSPDSRQHRGAHPEDRKLFSRERLQPLREAVADLSWMLGRDYSLTSSLKLVGDRYRLVERQRVAVGRAACSDQQRRKRSTTCRPFTELKAEPIVIDGFNLLITIEAALSDAVVILCADGCARDLSSVHGSYRSVQETETAIDLIGQVLEPLGVASARWLLDKPISNSGRLAQKIRDIAFGRSWPWRVELAFNPDSEMIGSSSVVVTSDSLILDQAAGWANLSRLIIQERIPESWVIDLSPF